MSLYLSSCLPTVSVTCHEQRLQLHPASSSSPTPPEAAPSRRAPPSPGAQAPSLLGLLKALWFRSPQLFPHSCSGRVAGGAPVSCRYHLWGVSDNQGDLLFFQPPHLCEQVSGARALLAHTSSRWGRLSSSHLGPGAPPGAWNTDRRRPHSALRVCLTSRSAYLGFTYAERVLAHTSVY